MNNQNKYLDDALSQYINSERIEKAPEEFTSKVMASIQTEAMPLKTAGSFRKINLVPVISVSVTIILILTAFFIPDNEIGSSFIPVADLIKNIKISLPEFDIKSIFRFDHPVLLIYVFIGIILLTLFDIALNLVFHHKKSQ